MTEWVVLHVAKTKVLQRERIDAGLGHSASPPLLAMLPALKIPQPPQPHLGTKRTNARTYGGCFIPKPWQWLLVFSWVNTHYIFVVEIWGTKTTGKTICKSCLGWVIYLNTTFLFCQAVFNICDLLSSVPLSEVGLCVVHSILWLSSPFSFKIYLYFMSVTILPAWVHGGHKFL